MLRTLEGTVNSHIATTSCKWTSLVSDHFLKNCFASQWNTFFNNSLTSDHRSNFSHKLNHFLGQKSDIFFFFSVLCMIKRKSQLKCHRVQFLWCWQIRTAYFNPADTSIDTVICCKLFVLIFNSTVLWDSPSTMRCEKSLCFPSRYESTLKTNRDSPVQVLYMSPTGSKERLCQRPSCKIPSNKLFKQNIWRKH